MNILIIEDDDAIRDLLSINLSIVGYKEAIKTVFKVGYRLED